MEVSQFGDLFPFPSFNPIEAIPFLMAQKLAELLQSSSTFDYFSKLIKPLHCTTLRDIINGETRTMKILKTIKDIVAV